MRRVPIPDSWADLDSRCTQSALERGDGDRPGVKDAGSERRIDAGFTKHRGEMRHRAGAARGDERYPADFPDGSQLLDVISFTHAIAPHAVEDDLARAALLHFAHPRAHLPPRVAGTCRIAGELIRAVTVTGLAAIDAHDDALRAEAPAQRADELRVGKRRRVDRHLLCASVEDLFGITHRADAARHAERNVEDLRDPAHPCAVHRALLRACGDVIEDELIRALVAIPHSELDDVAHDTVVAKAHALYDLTVADVEAGDDASGKNGRSSSDLMRSSSKALPLTAAATPVAASAWRSAASRTPPEACQAICGKRRTPSR